MRRARGRREITVRKAIDCIVAATAIAREQELHYVDGDFDPFEAHTDLHAG